MDKAESVSNIKVKKVLKSVFKSIIFIIDKAIWTLGALILALIILLWALDIENAYDFDIAVPESQTIENVDISN